MSRARKRRTPPLSVSLFPFLAVLICTLGVLIVMLVLAVKSADDESTKRQANVDEDKSSEIAAAQDQADFAQLRIDGIQSARPSLLGRLKQSRENRSHLQDEIRKTQKLLSAATQRLEASQKSLAKKNPTPISNDELAKAEKQTADLKAKIAAAQTELTDKKNKFEQRGPNKFVIVPHRGGGGTYRRPIYIECSADKIELQPLGISLNKASFQPPIAPGNPLDAALLTIREYWQRLDVAGEAGSPYPLMVVRPDGADTFVLARRAMKSWTDEFGYELVDAKKELDFGKLDTVLAAEVKQVIDEATIRQQKIATQRKQLERHLAQFRSGGNRGGGLKANSRGGGFVRTGGDNWNDDQTDASIGGRATQASANADATDSKGAVQQARHNFDSTDLRSNDFAASSAATSQSKNQAAQPNGPNSNPQNSNSPSSGAANQNGNAAVASPNSDMSLASQRGNGWALPSRTSGGTGYLRPITIVCSQHGIQFRSATGSNRQIPFKDSTQSAVDPLVEEVWRLIDSWGIAGQGSYWKPQLNIVTQLGGEQRFSELQGLLLNSGLVLKNNGTPNSLTGQQGSNR
jgi:hypothetical protein